MHEALIHTKYADIQFSVNGQTVKAISIILDIRCPTLLTKGIASKKRKERITYQLTPNEYMTKDVLTALLHFLYSGILPPAVPNGDLIRLLKISKVYQLRPLQDHINKLLWAAFTKSNIFELKKVAETVRSQAARNLVNLFIILKYNSLVRDKITGIEAIPEPSRADIKAANHKLNSIKQYKKKIDPSWENDWEAILIKMDKHDFLIVDDEKMHQGACHKAILAAHSPEMAMLVETCKKSGEYFSSLTALSIEALLRWLYFGAPLTDHNFAAEILTFAVEFKIDKLLQACEELLLPCITAETVFIILQIVISTKATKSQLKDACLDFIVVHLPSLDFTQLKEMPPFVAQEVVRAVQRSIGSYWIVSNDMASVAESDDSSDRLQVVMVSTSDNDAKTTSSIHKTASDTQSPNSLIGSSTEDSRDMRPKTDTTTSSEVRSLNKTDSQKDSSTNNTPQKETRKNDSDQSGSREDSENGSDSDESFHIKNFLPDPASELTQRNLTQQSVVILAKKKRKKVQGVKDLDDLFGF